MCILHKALFVCHSAQPLALYSLSECPIISPQPGGADGGGSQCGVNVWNGRSAYPH